MRCSWGGASQLPPALFTNFFGFILLFFQRCVFFSTLVTCLFRPRPREGPRGALSAGGGCFFSGTELRTGLKQIPNDPRGGGAPALVLNGSPKTTWAADAPNPFVLSLGNLTWPNILIGIVLQRQKGMSNFLSHSAIVGGWEVAPHNTQTLTCDGGSSALVCVAACGQRLI